MVKVLSEIETRFLDALFCEENPEADYEIAKQLAGYPKEISISSIVKSLAQNIVERAQGFVELNTPQAALRLAQAMRADSPVSKQALKASLETLDRGGVTKKETIEVKHDVQNAVIFLPAKLPDKDDEE